MRSSDLGAPEHFFTFRMLGSLEIEGEKGRAAPAGRIALLVSLLLVRANQVVSIDSVVEAIWGEEPPSTARGQVVYCIHALRAQLDRLGVAAKIVTEPPGYRLDVEPAQVDALVFDGLVRDARTLIAGGELRDGAALLRHALTLWRGRVLDGTNAHVRELAAPLEELWLHAQEQCLGAELELGRHQEVVAELQTLVQDHPLDEQLRYLLMLALYRCGRQNDALDVFHSGRAISVDRLGLDPGERLQALKNAIVASDAAVLRAAAVGPARRPDAWPAPRQLPADIGDFTGRDAAVETLELTFASEGLQVVTVANVYGKPGVGKSALAVHAAHRLATTTFPDGQLYASFAGSVSTHVVLEQFLRALGMDGRVIPATETERAMAYRSLLASRRVLVVLDDVPSEARLGPLIPGSAGCGVIATSRIPLAGAVGVRLVHVDVLAREHALRLLGKLVGEHRLAAEPSAAEMLVESVGRLPLALRIIGARLAARPHWPLAELVARLADERGRLDELAHGDLAVRSSLGLSHRALTGEQAALLRGLAGVEAVTIPGWCAGALLDDPSRRAADRVDSLVDAQLLDPVAVASQSQPRYRFHDLVRLFAREQPGVSTEDPKVLGRVLGGWLALTDHAHRGLYGGDYTTVHGGTERWPVPAADLAEVAANPLSWLEAERENLCAAVEQAAAAGLPEACWELSLGMVSLFEVRSYYDDWLRTHNVALLATRAAGDVRGTAALRCSLASLHLSRSRLDLAEEVLVPALHAFESLGDASGLALTHRNLGLLHRFAGDEDGTRFHLERSLERFEQVRDVVGQSSVLGHLAQLDLDRGDYRLARQTLEHASELCEGLPGVRVHAQIRHRIGKVLIAQGRYQPASVVMNEVLDLVRRTGDLQGQVHCLHMLGIIGVQRGRLAEAARHLDEAIGLCELNRDEVGAARIELDLARLERARGRTVLARSLEERATAAFRAHGIRPADVVSEFPRHEETARLRA